MSDLQIVLIILGVIIIAAVLLYNWQQERKIRNDIAESFITPQKDVLVNTNHIDVDAYVDEIFANDSQKENLLDKTNDTQQETSIADAPPQTATASGTEAINLSQVLPSEPAFASDNVSVEHASVPAGNETEIVTEPATEETDPTLPDDVHAHIDLTAILYASKNITLQALLLLSDAIEKDMGMAMKIHVKDKHDVWHMANDGAAPKDFKQIACSTQLADRGGPAAKQALNKFQFSVENMGLELNAHVEWQNNSDAYTQATSLDQFCMEVDQLVNVHLVQDDAPVHGTKFKGLAEASGMQLGEDGKYYYPGSEIGAPQFVLINADHQPFTTESLRNNVVKGASFQIEIPKVPNSEQTFMQMIDVAKKWLLG